MSYTSTYKLFRTKVSHIGEHRNGHGSGPIVWDYLETKYLPKQEYRRQIAGNMQEVWDLVRDPRVEEHEKAALLATFDWSYCPTHRLNYAADLLDKFYEESYLIFPHRANHWSAIAADYRAAGKDKRMLGVCIGCTSVSDPWDEYPKFSKPVWAYSK